MRLEDWPERLIDQIQRHSTIPFEWGKSDCVTFPMDCVSAMTGEDPSRDHRHYSTPRGAAKALAKNGFASVGDAFAAHFEEIPPAMAQRGDIGVVEGEAATAGVVFMDVPIGKDVNGTRRVSRSLVTRAFRVS